MTIQTENVPQIPKATPKSPPGTHTKSTLFIRNIPSTYNNANLEEFFAEYGPLRSAFIVKKPSSKTNIAFVHFALAEDAKRALDDCCCYGSTSSSNNSTSKDATTKYITSLDHSSSKNNKTKKEDRILVEQALRKKENFKEDSSKKTKTSQPQLSHSGSEKTPSKKEEHLATFSIVVDFEGDDLTVIDKKMLWKRFRKAGPLKTLTFPYLSSPSKAHLQFARPTDAKKAITKLDSHTIRNLTMRASPAAAGFNVGDSVDVVLNNNNVLDVDVTSSLSPNVTTTTTAPPSSKENRLIIRNLSFKAGEKEIRAFFASQGLVPASISIPLKADSATMSAGFAFVQMKNSLDANRSIASLNGESICGRVVAIDHSLSKSAFQKSAGSVAGSVEGSVIESDTADSSSPITTIKTIKTTTTPTTTTTTPTNPEEPSSAAQTTASKDVFIRNLPFGIEEDDLKAHFESQFGPLCYMKLVKDPASGAPRGTAFARFVSEKDAFACLAAAASAAVVNSAANAKLTDDDSNEMHKRMSSLEGKLDELSRRRSGRLDQQQQQQQQQNNPLLIEGRVIHVMEAMTRESVERTILQKEKERSSLGYGYLDANQHDRRNLFLIREALIKPRSEDAARFFPAADVSWRDELVKERKAFLKKNPNNFVSPTRLSFRHLPATLSEAELKSFLRGALEVAIGEHEMIIPAAEGDVGAIEERMLKHAIIPEKLMVSKAQAVLLADRAKPSSTSKKMKQVKLISSKADNDSGTRNKGYGFVEMCDHYHALLLTRFLTQFSPVYWRKDPRFLREHHSVGSGVFQSKVPLIEFATEKASIVAKRQQRQLMEVGARAGGGSVIAQKDLKRVGGGSAGGKALSSVRKPVSKKSKIDRF